MSGTSLTRYRPPDNPVIPIPDAPTLIAGQTTGDHGAVRVMQPHLRGSKLWFILLSVAAAGGILLMTHGTACVGFFFAGLFPLIPVLVGSVFPSVIVVDSTGMAVGVKAAAHDMEIALQWSDIRHLTIKGGLLAGAPAVVRVSTGQRTLTLNLGAYDPADRKELIDQMIAGSGLVPHPYTRSSYISLAEIRERNLPIPEAVAELPSPTEERP